MCKEYEELYKQKIQSKKLNPETEKKIKNLEEVLDVMNIVLIRGKVIMELEMLAKEEEKLDWFSTWLGIQEKPKRLDIAAMIRTMTPAEKKRFYEDIDYNENVPDPTQPKNYEDISGNFLLEKFVIKLYNMNHNILLAKFLDVKLNLVMRSSANALAVNAKINAILITGLNQGVYKEPTLMSCNPAEDGALCSVSFETNPLNSKFPLKLYASIKPSTVIYDAVTINTLMDFVTIPRSSTLQQLSDVASFDNVKYQSSAKIQYAIDNHSQIDLVIDLYAPYVIIPYAGHYSGTENVIAINLGRVKFVSIAAEKSAIKEKQRKYTQEELLEALKAESYDKFMLSFSDFQVLLVPGYEDWLPILKKSPKTKYHVLYPMNLDMELYICLVDFDPRLPKCKIEGALSSISLNITDYQLVLTLGLIKSIPFPQTEETAPIRVSKDNFEDLNVVRPSSRYLNVDYKAMESAIEAKVKNKPGVPAPQHTSLDFDFLFGELSVNIKHQEYGQSPIQDVARISLKSLAAIFKVQTYAQVINLELENFAFNTYHKNFEVPIVVTSGTFINDKVFEIKFLKVDKKSPDFASTFKSTETLLSIEVDVVKIKLHQEILQSLVKYVNDLQIQCDEVLRDDKPVRLRASSSSVKMARKSLNKMLSASQAHIDYKKSRISFRGSDTPNILVKLEASLQEFQVTLASDFGDITSLTVNNVVAQIIIKEPYTQVNATLKNIDIKDLSPHTKYFQIIKVLSDEVINFNLFLYDKLIDTSRREDMAASVSIGHMEIVFLNFYVARVLDFVNKFTQARDAIIEASKAAADKAKQNVASMYENATQMLITVDLKAPKVIIPEKSYSFYGLQCDLGNLTIKNKFLDLNIINENTGSNVVIDEIVLRLSNTQVFRIESNKDLNIRHSIIIVEPVNFNLKLNRNLSASWYKSIPDIQVKGHFETIQVVLGQADYGVVMVTLIGNLEEGSPQSAVATSEIKPIREIPSVIAETACSKPDDSSSADISIFIKFSLIMTNFSIKLLSTDDYLKNPRSFKTARSKFATVSFEDFCIKGRMMSDGVLYASIVLVDCVLTDTRIGREGAVNKMFSKTFHADIDSTDAGYKSMVDIIYQKKEDHTYIDLKISEFDLILSMEFLLTLLTFLSSVNEDYSDANNTLMQNVNASTTKITKSLNQIEAENVEYSTYNVKIEKPDIVLVENLNNINTSAIIINFEFLVKQCTHENRKVINGIVKDIQMYTCCYNPTEREKTKNHLMLPFTVNIAGVTPEDKGLHAEVCLTEIRIKISLATIQLLNRAYAAMFLTEHDSKMDGDNFTNLYNLWEPKPYNEKQYWFFKTNDTEDSIEYIRGALNPVSFEGRKYEMCIIRLPSFIVTLEIGDGNAAMPVVMLQSSFEGNARDWSTDMVIDSTVTVQIVYYNSNIAVWEPLIEPVGIFTDNGTLYQPWELKLYVCMNNENGSSTQLAQEGEEIQLSGIPKISVGFSSNSNLEITVSKATLEAFSNLGQAFADEADLNAFKPSQRDNPPYKIINRSGLTVKIDCNHSKFHVYQQAGEKSIIMEHGVEVILQHKEIERQDYSVNQIFQNANIPDKKLYITVLQMQWEIELNLTRPDTRFFSLNYRDNRDIWGIVVTMVIEQSTFKVILSSIVKIYNHLHLPINVYCITPNEQEKEFVGSIEPEETFYVPVNAVYTPTCELFFSIQKYSVTTQPFVWKHLYLKVNQIQLLQCSPTTLLGHSEPFVIKTISNIEQIYNENTVKRTMNSILCNIHIHPSVLFRNYLPYKVSITVQNIDDEFLVEPGCTLPITNGIPGASYLVVTIPNYLDKGWTCIQHIPASPPHFSVWTFHCYDSTLNVVLNLGLHCVEDKGPLLMTLYCPFWMLNKSKLNIAYKTCLENFNVIHHPANFKGPILFTFSAKNYFIAKKTAIRIEYGGEWSDKFSIDVAGSSGVIICKYDFKFYQFGINIELANNGLTKQVTFTPYYVLINKSPFPLECQEHNRPRDAWTIVNPNSCAALWPVGDFDDKLLRMRVVGTSAVSPPFYISDSHNTVLKLANKYGGIHVDVQITEGAVYITFAKYEPGMAIALIINNTRNTLNIWEKDTVQLLKLNPGHQMLYSWSNPSKTRVICWEAGYKREIQDDLRKDGYGDYEIAENNHVYWTSFLDGMQRTLLFTCNKKVARNAQCADIFANIDQEVTFSIFGLGLSIVNNNLKKEIMYIAFANSGVIWETCKHGSYRYKQMSSKESAAIEAAYKQYLCMKSIEPRKGRMVVDLETEVNFETLRMLKPRSRKIRRTFLHGLWFQMSTNPYMLQFHAKINRIQIDNQSYGCMFPVVLAPVSLPKSVAGTDIHKPFAELSIMQRLIKHSQIKQFKYFKLFIQEFDINVELGFIMAVSEVFQASEDTLDKQKAYFLLDADLVNKPLYQHVSHQSQHEQKSFYDLLHFSPLKIHMSFSLGSAGGAHLSPNVVSVLLQSVGVTLTDMQGVIFRIAYFEREYMFLTQKQLIGEAVSHYVKQAVKQLYALLLGLDVLGNPYGFVLGITKGVEDLFYEPFQGAIQGPGEFAEGLALGVRSFFSYTIGGAAGAVARITGAMGKGVAALTFDKEFQRKRRDALARKATVSEGIATSGKGLFLGVFHGVTGIIIKPISGAKQKGIGGFFQGLGKGTVGLVARPTTGVIDFVSGSLNTVKRVTDLTAQEVNRLRPSRYIYFDGLIRPYNEREAIGNKILIELEKGKFALTDMYLHHFSIVGKKQILMLTDQRLLYIKHNDIFGIWQAEWSYTWDEISMPPKVVPKGVLVMSSDQKKKKKLFSRADLGKTIVIPDANFAEFICLVIIEVHSTHYS
nr:vacuolar protein sorting-associated protein 13-like [Onthophagus taurus]